MRQSDDLMPYVLAAMNWRDDEQWSADAVLATPELAHYVAGWMRDGDAGVIAHVGGEPAGAAWWRTFTNADPGYGYVADDVPEVGLAVLGPYRRRGLASGLMSSLVARAAANGVRALSLSVEDGNSVARALYERAGFVTVGRVGDSDTLLLELRGQSMTS